MWGKYYSIMKPGFAVSTHFTQLYHLSVSINSDSPCYTESEVSANEIFKHLKSLKTNLLNVLPFPIKSAVCNYIRPVITRFHDLLCSCVVSVSVCLRVYCVCTNLCNSCIKVVNHRVRKYLCGCVCLCVCWRKTRWWKMMLLACLQNDSPASLSFVGR